MLCSTRMGKPNFICVGGKAGSGKDHCVSILTNALEKQGKTIFQTAFADHLKQQCCNVTGIPLHMWHMPSSIKQKDNSALRVVNCRDKFFVSWCVDNKHSVDVPRSMRWWMQHYSDYKKAKHGDNYYIDYVVDVIQEQLEISKPDYVVLTDCRYLSELQQYINIPNAYSVYVNNPENIILGEQHNSEHLGQEAFQHVILNTYSTREEAILGQWKEILEL
jgi:hypothetical protein